MISRRAKRSATPQETLRQFALNTTKGVDSTKAPTDNETVVRLTNLAVNLDGSVSPRKPVKQLREFKGSSFVEYLYDEQTVLRIGPTTQEDAGGEGLRLYSGDTPLTFILKYTDFYGNVMSVYDVDAIPLKYVRYLSEAHGVQVLNLNSSSIICNLSIAVDEWILTSRFMSKDKYLHLNPSLYDDDTRRGHFSPRYLSVQFSNGRWIVEIKSPEINEVLSTDSSSSIAINTTLDNPYAVRDTYDVASPTVKGILPYAYSEKIDSGIIPAYQTVSEGSASADFEYTLNPTVVLDAQWDYSDAPADINYKSSATVMTPLNAFGAYVRVDIALRNDGPKQTRHTIAEDLSHQTVPCHVRCYRYINLAVKTSVHVPAQASLTGKVYTLKVDSIDVSIDTPGLPLSLGGDTGTTLKYTPSSSDFEYYTPTYVGHGYGEVPMLCKATVGYTDDSDNGVSELNVQFARDGEYTDDKAYAIDPKFSTDQCTFNVTVKGSLSWTYYTTPLPDTVAELTESVKSIAYRPCAVSSVAAPATILKAICALPTPSEESLVYASWVRSTDGYTWDDAVIPAPNTLDVRDVTAFFGDNSDANKPSDSDSESDSKKASRYTTRRFIKVNPVSKEHDNILVSDSFGNKYTNRPDVLYLGEEGGYNGVPAQYLFRICVLKPITADDEDPAFDSSMVDENGDPVTTQYKVALECGRAVSIPQYGPEALFTDYPYGNTVAGAKLYYKKAIYSYDYSKFFNNIFVSGIDSFVTPLYNIIDADVSESKTVTCLTPWRDYLISATENTMVLHSKSDAGYTSKPISTSVGISQAYAKCCKAALNGIVFMSENAVYLMYPNVYSGNDDILNLTCISTPVENYLYEHDVLDGYSRFAFITSTEYVLMIPYEHRKLGRRTLCLRYDLTDRFWRVSEYPLPFYTYRQFGFDDVRLYCADSNSLGDDGSGSVREFQFDHDVRSDTSGLGAYGDVIGGEVVPIEFEWDTGQKTDSIAQTKQFVESKLMFATGDALETFPMELTVAIDGDPHVVHKDINTDSPFWNSDDLETKGTLGTTFRLGNEGLGYSDKGVLRQLVVRYSGKGRSIRHILKGRTRSNFKLYETYVRYKTLNVKR